MTEIIDGLYVGGDDDYQKADAKRMSIASMCKDGPHGHRAMLGYTSHAAPKGKTYLYAETPHHLAVNLVDSEDPNFIPEAAITEALSFIHNEHNAGHSVLVHCNQGQSRGPTTALMYLRTIGEMPHPFITAEKIFRGLYPQYDPAQGIRQYARSHWASLENINASTRST